MAGEGNKICSTQPQKPTTITIKGDFVEKFGGEDNDDVKMLKMMLLRQNTNSFSRRKKRERTSD